MVSNIPTFRADNQPVVACPACLGRNMTARNDWFVKVTSVRIRLRSGLNKKTNVGKGTHSPAIALISDKLALARRRSNSSLLFPNPQERKQARPQVNCAKTHQDGPRGH